MMVVPEADDSSVWGYLYIAKPQDYEDFFKAATTKKLDSDAMSKSIGKLYGFEDINAIDWSKPLLFAWVQGHSTPMVVVTVLSKDEFLTPLPEEHIDNHQGNDFAFPISVAKTAYVNFIGEDQVVLSSEWRQYPVAAKRLDALINQEYSHGFSGELDFSHFEILGNAIATTRLPHPVLAPDWDDTRVAIEDLVTGLKSCRIEADSKAGAIVVNAQCAPREKSAMARLIASAEAANPQDLLKVLSSFQPRSWLWQNLSKVDVKVQGALVWTSSLPLLQITRADDAYYQAERTRFDKFTGPTLIASHGFGDDRVDFNVAQSKDLDALTQLEEGRTALLEAAAKQSTLGFTALEPPRFKRRQAPDAFLAFLLGELSVLEAHYGTRVVSAASKTIENSVKVASLLGRAAADEDFALPESLQGLPGKPLVIAALDLAPNTEAQGTPVTFAFVTKDEGLELILTIPKGQFANLELDL